MTARARAAQALHRAQSALVDAQDAIDRCDLPDHELATVQTILGRAARQVNQAIGKVFVGGVP